MCVLARASISRDAEFLLGACILALATPLPLLLFTDLSAHRIYIAQLLVAILAAVLGSLPPVRRWLVPKRAARSACHRAALAQFALRGIDRSQCGALVYVSLAEHYIRIVPAEEADRAVTHDQWQAAVDEALGRLPPARPRPRWPSSPTAAPTFSPDPSRRASPWTAQRQRFHIV